MKYLYKSLPKDKSPHGHKFVLNRWYHEDTIAICKSGFHASENILDAMEYVNAEWLALVEVKGESEIHSDKQCWSDMRVVKFVRWTQKDSIALAIFVAELVLDKYEKEYPKDTRPREAIEAAKAVLRSDTEKNREVAEAAAWAVEAAAWVAAWAAAKAAAWAAEAAAWVAAWAAAKAAEAKTASRAAEAAAWVAAKAASATSAAAAAWAADSAKLASESVKEGQKTLQQCHDFVINHKNLRV